MSESTSQSVFDKALLADLWAVSKGLREAALHQEADKVDGAIHRIEELTQTLEDYRTLLRWLGEGFDD